MIQASRAPHCAVAKPVEDLRAELGLEPAGHPMIEGQFSRHGTLALFSRVLAEPQRDWPPNVTITGTVFYNGSEPLDPTLEEFLAAGEPPVVFTLGTSAVGAAGRFYHESAAAAAKLVRAVMLTGGFAQNRPTTYRLTCLADRARTSSCSARERHRSSVRCRHDWPSAAQRAPTLARAHGHDQLDNAPRAQARVARTAIPQEYRADRVARDLRALLDDVRYVERAAAVSIGVREERGAETAVAVIEKLLAFNRALGPRAPKHPPPLR
jgi:UDP:flavonoid glycosyltransferase YjiC (YdhE family)